MTEKTTSKSNLPTIVATFFLLAAFTFFLRVPFFFKDVIDWDESTFILMGQSILDGYLPYLEIWDNKPPLIFAIFALFIKFFGHNIAGIRIAGTLCIIILAYFLYLSSYEKLGKKIALITTLLSIFLMSLLRSGQGVTSEHLALLGIIPAFYLITTKDYRKPMICFGMSLLLGCATLIRLNIIYLSFFVGIWLLFTFLKHQETKVLIFKNAIAYISGHVLVFGLTFIPYLYQGEGYEWWKSVILAPLAYAQSQGSVLNSLLFLMGNDVLIIPGTIGVILTINYVKLHRQHLSQSLLEYYTLLGLFYASIAFSIIKTGATLDHYLIQIAPFLALAIGLNLQITQPNKTYRKTAIFLCFSIIIFGITKEYSPLGSNGYPNLLGKITHQESIWEGNSFAMANYLKAQADPPTTLFILGTHLVHWHTHTLPLSKCSTHPSNIFRESLLPFCGMNEQDNTPLSEIQYILQQKPSYLLIQNYRFEWIQSRPEIYSFWQSFLQENYTLISQDFDHNIYHLVSLNQD